MHRRDGSGSSKQRSLKKAKHPACSACGRRQSDAGELTGLLCESCDMKPEMTVNKDEWEWTWTVCRDLALSFEALLSCICGQVARHWHGSVKAEEVARRGVPRQRLLWQQDCAQSWVRKSPRICVSAGTQCLRACKHRAGDVFVDVCVKVGRAHSVAFVVIVM